MIAWSPQFAWRYESRWALLQKLEWLNGAQPPTFRRRPWPLPERGAPQCTLQEALDARTPENLLGYGWSDFASKAPLRLCEQCTRVGYHSVVQQIDGLANCPLHGCPLRSRCPRCGGWLMERDAFVGFRCAQCGQSLLDEDLLPTVTGAMLAREQATIGAVARWIRTSQTCGGPMRHRSRNAGMDGPWLRCSLSDDTVGVSYATAMPQFLNEAVAFPLDTALLASRPIGLYAIHRSTLAASDVRASTTQSEPVVRYRDILRDVDQRILSRIQKRHSTCLNDASTLYREAGLYSMFLLRLCPVTYGYVLWRARANQWVDQMHCTYVGVENYLTGYSAIIERRALLNAFYAGVQSAIVTSTKVRDEMDVLRNAPVMASPWIPDRYSQVQNSGYEPAVQLVLEDRDALSGARCDHGFARRVWTRIVEERFERLYQAISAADDAMGRG